MEVREPSAKYLAKPAYKQTEVGVIPEDWNVHLIGELLSISAGRDLVRSEFSDVQDDKHPYPIYSNARSDGGLYGYSSSFQYGRDSVTVTARGDVGYATHRKSDFCAIGRLIVLAARQACDLRLVTDYINTRVSFAFESTGVPQLTAPQISSYRIALPSTLCEQQAIADALSDADALIEALEQLLAKKRQIKQGAMQELLTGQKRLPGFAGEWEVKRLGNIAEIVMGQSPRSVHYNSKGDGLPLIQGNADISDRKTIRRIFTTEITKHGHRGDILMSVRAPVGEISTAAFDVCLGRGVCAIRYPNNFLYHALIAKEPQWIKLSKGSTFDSVNSTDVKTFEIEIPEDEAEQFAIATVLADMDAEIAALEAKLAKARRLKQGMMQELLTGRIRLV